VAGGNQGANLAQHYGYLASLPAGESLGFFAFLKATLEHPISALRQLWAHRIDIWGYVSSAGLIGLVSPWAVLPILVLVQSELTAGNVFSSSDFQNLPVVLFLIPLSVIALARFAGRRDRRRGLRMGPSSGQLGAAHRARGNRGRRLVPILAVVMGANALAWGLVWIPQIPSQWIRVSPAAASTLDQVSNMIPANAEVVASQGVIGRFADRHWLYALGAGKVLLQTSVVYFVITPNQGIEQTTVPGPAQASSPVPGSNPATGSRTLGVSTTTSQRAPSSASGPAASGRRQSSTTPRLLA